jgi:glutathione S-transferase
MRLHHSPASTVCRPILLLAQEASLTLERREVDLLAGEHLTERFAALNPNRAVPVLEGDGFVLTECSAILKYLAELHRLPCYPSEPRARATVNALMDWFNTGFMRQFAYGLVYPQVLPHLAWQHPAMAAVALTRSEREVTRLLNVLDSSWLAHGRGPYLGGEAPDLADIMGACCVSLGELIGFDFYPWPRVHAWLGAMRARPSWAPANVAFHAWSEELRAARRPHDLAA